MPRVKELQDMEIDEISLVDRPAAQHAKVVIAKRANEEETVPEDIYNEDGELLDTETLEEGDVVFDEEGQAFVVVDEESDMSEYEEVGKAIPPFMQRAANTGYNAIGRATRATEGAGKAAGKKIKSRYVKPGTKSETSGFDGKTGRDYSQAVITGPSANWKNIGTDAGAATVAGGASAYGYKKVKKSFADELREELSKSYTDADRDEVIAKAMGQVEDMAASLAEAEEIAKSERDLRLTREYEEVAKNYNLPVEPSELAPVLMAIAESLPYEYGEVIHKALSAAGEIIFEEMGTQGYATNNDVLTSVDAYIDQNIAKADISKAQAVEAVFAENPNAYDEYMATRYGS